MAKSEKSEAMKRARTLLAAKNAASQQRKVFVPTDEQQAVVDSPALYRIISAGNRKGKSAIAGWELASILRGEHKLRPCPKGAEYMIMCLSRRQAYTVWSKILFGEGIRPTSTHSTGFINNSLIKRKSNGNLAISWDYAGGLAVPTAFETHNNIVYFGWHGVLSSWKRIQGMDVHGAILDEAGDDTEAFCMELLSRLMIPQSAHPNDGWVLWPATPTTVNETLDDWRAKAVSPDFPEFAEFELTKNPALSEDVLERMSRAMGEEEARVRLSGVGSRMDTIRIYPEFDKRVHVRETPYEASPKDNIVVSYDPGISDNTGIDIAMLNPASPRRLNFVKSIRLRGGDTAAEARALIGWLKGRKITWMTYDKHGASKSDRGGGSIISQFIAHLQDEELWQTGKPVLRKYKGEIDAGVRKVKTYLSPDPSEYFEPLISIDPPTEENGTANLINELANYRLKDSKYIGKPLKYNTIHEKKNEGPDNCIERSQLVLTLDGHKEICNISKGDMVLTRDGWRPVKRAWCSGIQPLVRLTLASGNSLLCTGDHRLATGGSSWERASRLLPGSPVVIHDGAEPRSFARDSVVGLQDAGFGEVWDLEVDGRPEFVVQGVVVHNCRYLVMSRPEWQDYGQNIETGRVHRLAVVAPPSDKPKEVVTREEAERRAEMERSRAIAERAAARCKKQRAGWKRRIGDVFHP